MFRQTYHKIIITRLEIVFIFAYQSLTYTVPLNHESPVMKAPILGFVHVQKKLINC